MGKIAQSPLKNKKVEWFVYFDSRKKLVVQKKFFSWFLLFNHFFLVIINLFFSILIILSLKFSEKKRGNPEIKLILMFHDGTAFRNFFFLNIKIPSVVRESMQMQMGGFFFVQPCRYFAPQYAFEKKKVFMLSFDFFLWKMFLNDQTFV